MPSRKAKYILEAEDRTKLALKNAEKSFDRFGKKVSSVSGLLAGLGVGLTFGAIINATKEQEAAMAQLEARLKSTGGSAGLTSKDLTSLATELQGITTYGDEAIIAMESLLLTFTNVKGDVFKEATQTILDMSTAMGTDLKGSAIQLGKALNDPVKGVSALAEVGVSFNQSQKDLIKTLVESGETQKAQRIILEELKVEFGGAAVAARDTFGGALQGLQNAFGDLLEAKSGLNDAKDQIESFTSLLSDPKTVAAFDSFASGIIKIGSAAADQLTKIINFTAALWELAGVASSRQGINYQADVDSRQQKEYIALLGRRYDIVQRIGELEDTGAVEHLKNQAQAELDAVEKELEKQGWVKGAGNTYVKPLELKVVDAPTDGKTDPIGTKPPKGQTSKANPFASALEGMQRQIGLLGTTTQYQKVLWEVENGRYKSLTENQKNALLDAAKLLDARTSEIESKQKLKEADLALDDEAQALRELLNPMEDVDAQLVRLDELLAKGKISWDTYAEGVFHTMEAMDEVPEKAQETADSLSVFADEAARSMQNAFADYLFDPFNNSMEDMLRGFVDTLRRMASEALSAAIFQSLFSGVGGGGGTAAGGFASFLASIFHDGGIVGEGGKQRTVSPLAFAGAERYHNGGIAGLAPNEVPAILQRGEMVIPRDQVGAAAAQSIRVNLFDDRSSVSDYIGSSEGERDIMQVVRRNQQAVKAML